MKTLIAMAFVLLMAGSVMAASVSDAVANPSAYSNVTEFSGTVESSGEHFYLSDGIAKILLGIGPQWFYGTNPPISNGETIKVNGIVEQSKKTGELELEARSIIKADGTVKEIKGEGRPAWAGAKGNGNKDKVKPLKVVKK
jgi:hypothetical protein